MLLYAIACEAAYVAKQAFLKKLRFFRSLQLLNLMVAQLLRFFKGLVKAYGL
jgi:hypothetical protein